MKTHPRIAWRLLAAALLLPVALAELGGWTLLWGDDFEGSRLDEGRWYSEVGAGCQYLAPDDYPLCGWGMDEMVRLAGALGGTQETSLPAVRSEGAQAVAAGLCSVMWCLHLLEFCRPHSILASLFY